MRNFPGSLPWFGFGEYGWKVLLFMVFIPVFYRGIMVLDIRWDFGWLGRMHYHIVDCFQFIVQIIKVGKVWFVMCGGIFECRYFFAGSGGVELVNYFPVGGGVGGVGG